MTDWINIIGLMSGTSVDGLDVCYVSFPKNKIEEYEILNCTTVDYPTDLKNQLNNIINYDQRKIKEIDLKFGEFIGLSINKFLKENKLDLPDLISSHGHTVFHNPEEKITYQIGNRSELSKSIALPVICDFRIQDVQLGGQGLSLIHI